MNCTVSLCIYIVDQLYSIVENIDSRKQNDYALSYEGV